MTDDAIKFRIRENIDKMSECQENIMKYLSKMSGYGSDDCVCGDTETILLLNEETEYPEIEKFCINCGALIWERA